MDNQTLSPHLDNCEADEDLLLHHKLGEFNSTQTGSETVAALKTCIEHTSLPTHIVTFNADVSSLILECESESDSELHKLSQDYSASNHFNAVDYYSFDHASTPNLTNSGDYNDKIQLLNHISYNNENHVSKNVNQFKNFITVHESDLKKRTLNHSTASGNCSNANALFILKCESEGDLHKFSGDEQHLLSPVVELNYKTSFSSNHFEENPFSDSLAASNSYSNVQIDDGENIITKRQTKWALQTFEKWRTSQNELPSGKFINPLDNMNIEELNDSLSLFVREVCKPDGQPYPGTSLLTLTVALFRYLRKKNMGMTNMSRYSAEFTKFRKALYARVRDLQSADLRGRVKQAMPISLQHENLLWDKGLLGSHSSKALFNTVFFYNMKLFGLKTFTAHCLLLRDQFKVGEDDGGKYIQFFKRSKTLCELEKNKVAKLYDVSNEVGGHDIHFVYSTYLKAIASPGYFYRRPMRSIYNTLSFSTQPMSADKIATMLSEMCREAGLTGQHSKIAKSNSYCRKKRTQNFIAVGNIINTFAHHSGRVIDPYLVHPDERPRVNCFVAADTVITCASDPKIDINSEGYVEEKPPCQPSIYTNVSSNAFNQEREVENNANVVVYSEKNLTINPFVIFNKDINAYVQEHEPECDIRLSCNFKEVPKSNHFVTSRNEASSLESESAYASSSCSDDKPMSSDFIAVNSDINVLLDDESKNTKRQTIWSERIFEKWRAFRNTLVPEKVISPLEEMSAEQMNDNLSLFVLEVRKPDGQSYSGKTLYLLIMGLLRSLREKGINMKNILDKHDVQFLKFRKVLDSRIREIQAADTIVASVKQTTPITSQLEDILWKKGLFGAHSSEALFNTVFFYNEKGFGLKSKNDHRALQCDQFKFGEDECGKYILFSKRTKKSGYFKSKLGSKLIKLYNVVSEDGIRDLHFIYSTYLKAIGGTGYFYRRPLHNNANELTFSKQPMGINKMATVLSKVYHDAGLPGNFTNRNYQTAQTKKKSPLKRLIAPGSNINACKCNSELANDTNSSHYVEERQMVNCFVAANNVTRTFCNENKSKGDTNSEECADQKPKLSYFVIFNNDIDAYITENEPENDTQLNTIEEEPTSNRVLASCNEGYFIECEAESSSSISSEDKLSSSCITTVSSDDNRQTPDCKKKLQTKRQTSWSLHVFEKWRKFRNELPSGKIISPLEDMSVEQMNEYLSLFVLEVRKPDGQPYPGKTLLMITMGLLRYLREKDVNVNIIGKNDANFVKFRKVLKARMEELRAAGIGTHVKKTSFITAEQEDILWNKGLLGSHSSEALLNTVFFYNVKLFSLLSIEEHRSLQCDEFKCSEDQHGKYILFSRCNTKVDKFKDNFDKSPIKLYNILYKSRDLHAIYSTYLKVIGGIGCFYRRPLAGCDGGLYFSLEPLGINKLKHVLSEMCHKAGLTGHFTFGSAKKIGPNFPRKTGTNYTRQTGAKRLRKTATLSPGEPASSNQAGTG